MGTYITLRDPVHGDIFLEPEDIRIIDTREMQRLRGIKQLGTAYLVYPGALHTRFEHAIGTMHMAYRIVESLRMSGAEISKDDEVLIRSAALVHDITHVPFGHTFEDERKAFPRHDMDEKRARLLLKEGDLGDILGDMGIVDDIFRVLYGKGENYISDIVKGTICADLLDYVRRDLYFTGINGNYDDRIFRYFTLEDDRLVLNMEKSGELRRDALSTIVDILRLRYILTERVYYHHAKASYGSMIAKAVEMAVSDKNPLKMEDLYWMSDNSLMDYLISKDKGTKKLAEGVKYRVLYKRAYMVSGEKHREKFVPYHISPPESPKSALQNRESAEWIISSSLGIEFDDIIIHAPSIDMQMKEADVLVKVPKKGIINLASMVHEVPEIKGFIENYRNLWKFYVFASPEAIKKVGKERIRKACERHFGVKSEI